VSETSVIFKQDIQLGYELSVCIQCARSFSAFPLSNVVRNLQRFKFKQLPIDCSLIKKTSSGKISLDYGEKGSKLYPLTKFYDGLDVNLECYPTACTVMKKDCLTALDSKHVSVKDFKIEVN